MRVPGRVEETGGPGAGGAARGRPSIAGGAAVGATVLAVAIAAGAARADDNPNGTVFRAVGWFAGKGEITTQNIKCEIPTVSTAISEGVFSFGMWNTYGFDSLFYPDINNPFGNPCGVWIQLQNNLTDQAIQIDHIELRYRIQGSRRFWQFVATRRDFPIPCRPSAATPASSAPSSTPSTAPRINREAASRTSPSSRCCRW